MNYKSFNLGDWIGHISGAIEDERELDGNEMRDLVCFLTTLEQEPCEDAISELKGLLKDHRHNFAKNSHEMRAWKLGIEDCIDVLYAINETNDKGTETHACVCDDSVSRQAVLECLDWYEHDKPEIDTYIQEIAADVKNLPPVQPIRKRGKWGGKCGYRTCSECGYSGMVTDDEGEWIPEFFCPNCGAMMEESNGET